QPFFSQHQSFPRTIFSFPRRSSYLTSLCQINDHEPPKNNNIRRSPTSSNPPSLHNFSSFLRRCPSPCPITLRPVKFGHEPPKNNNIRRSLALCLLHHPF
ncbi:hypothetical protein AABB24_010886, partial [Solanum stoloniferum]